MSSILKRTSLFIIFFMWASVLPHVYLMWSTYVTTKNYQRTSEGKIASQLIKGHFDKMKLGLNNFVLRPSARALIRAQINGHDPLTQQSSTKWQRSLYKVGQIIFENSLLDRLFLVNQKGQVLFNIQRSKNKIKAKNYNYDHPTNTDFTPKNWRSGWSFRPNTQSKTVEFINVLETQDEKVLSLVGVLKHQSIFSLINYIEGKKILKSGMRSKKTSTADIFRVSKITPIPGDRGIQIDVHQKNQLGFARFFSEKRTHIFTFIIFNTFITIFLFAINFGHKKFLRKFFNENNVVELAKGITGRGKELSLEFEKREKAEEKLSDIYKKTFFHLERTKKVIAEVREKISHSIDTQIFNSQEVPLISQESLLNLKQKIREDWQNFSYGLRIYSLNLDLTEENDKGKLLKSGEQLSQSWEQIWKNFEELEDTKTLYEKSRLEIQNLQSQLSTWESLLGEVSGDKNNIDWKYSPLVSPLPSAKEMEKESKELENSIVILHKRIIGA